jgi:hypothetical protein
MRRGALGCGLAAPVGTGNASAQRLRGMNRASAANKARSAGLYRPGRRSGIALRSRAGARAIRRSSPGPVKHQHSQAE